MLRTIDRNPGDLRMRLSGVVGRAVLKRLLPKRQVILDLYYTRQNDSRSATQHVNAIGATLVFYF